QVSGVARVALNLRGISTRELGRGMALIQPGQWTMTTVIDVRLAGPPARLPPQLTVHIGAARGVARVRVLGGEIARLSLDHALPLHIGDRVLLRDPGAAADRATGRPIFGATVLDVSPPRLRGNGAAAAAERELTAWPEPPTAADVLRRHRLLRAGTASAMGLRDPPRWLRLRQQLTETVAVHAKRDPVAPGLAVGAARAELGLPERELVEALAGWSPDGRADQRIDVSGGYLRPHSGLPAPVAKAVQAVLADLAEEPFAAPDSERLQQLGLEPRGAAAAERAGLLFRLPGNVVLAPDAAG